MLAESFKFLGLARPNLRVKLITQNPESSKLFREAFSQIGKTVLVAICARGVRLRAISEHHT
jgi:hypothetical protein